MESTKILEGYVESVADGDTIRFVPVAKFRTDTVPENCPKKVMRIRLAGIDCPETAHDGKPAQPLAEIAKEFTMKRTMKAVADSNGSVRYKSSKKVRVRVLSVDQYGRSVANVWYQPYPNLMPFFWRDISLKILEKGLAVVYRGGGAVYGESKAKYEAAESAAKKLRRGVWGLSNFVPPGDFKKQNSTR